MAIQMRRGQFSKFDPTRMVAGEFATVLSGDESASDGRAVYVCFAAGAVKRLATWDDAAEMLANAEQGLVAAIVADTDADIKALENRLSAAIDSATQTASDRMDEVLLGAVEYANLSDACKQAIAQSAAAGSSLLSEADGLAIVDGMTALIVAGRDGGTLSETDGLAIIDAILA